MVSRGINRNKLKYIAVIAMIMDHIAMWFIPSTLHIWFIFRVIGRLTAPIMCFFLAEGYFYTQSKKKYGLRLFSFAVISQIPYSLAKHNKLFTLDFSMIFTLFLCFNILLIYDKVKNNLIKWLCIVVLIFISFLGDWGIFAPLWVLIFWIFRGNKSAIIIRYSVISTMVISLNIVFCVMNNMYLKFAMFQIGVFGAIPLSLMYNGEPGRNNLFNKWFFYIIYPLHLLVIAIIK